MAVPLDIITRKKLILVRQLYQRALLQSEARHSYVDRIMALISFDLTIETILKAVVSSLNTSVAPKGDFQAIVQQADNELASAHLPPVPDKARIQHVRTLRNDAQHKAKYPNETDVSDCRTYTRDFLVQIILNVWDEQFESLSLTDLIVDTKVKTYLIEAESEIRTGDYREAAIKSVAALEWTFNEIKDSIVGRIPYYTNAFVVTESFKKPFESTEVFRVFMHMRDLLMRSVVGVNFPGYIRYKQITSSVVQGISFYEDGNFSVNLAQHVPNVQEAEYVAEFVVSAIIQIESLVGDINKPFNK